MRTRSKIRPDANSTTMKTAPHKHQRNCRNGNTSNLRNVHRSRNTESGARTPLVQLVVLLWKRHGNTHSNSKVKSTPVDHGRRCRHAQHQNSHKRHGQTRSANLGSHQLDSNFTGTPCAIRFAAGPITTASCEVSSIANTNPIATSSCLQGNCDVSIPTAISTMQLRVVVRLLSHLQLRIVPSATANFPSCSCEVFFFGA